MKATVYHGPRDVRVENVPDPTMEDARDAIVRVTRAAICGSDLWFYRCVTQWTPGDRTGHEFVGIVEEVGKSVRGVSKGDAVIAPFAWSDNTCEYCRKGLQTLCEHGDYFGGEIGGQAEFVRVPLADGTLVKMTDAIAKDDKKLDASVTLSDVMGTGHFGVVAAGGTSGSTVVVVGDGAVGLCAVLSAAKMIGAEQIIAVGHNAKRLQLAKQFGATHTFNSNQKNAQEEIVELTRGGAAHVVEAVGNQESMEFAINVARPGGTVGFVGVPHKVEEVPISTLFSNHISLRGGPAPVREYLPELIASLDSGRIDPTPVLDLALPLEKVPEGYAAMDERRAIKVMVRMSDA